MKEALLIRFGGLGDLLVALPSIRLVRGKYPQARLTLACRGEYGALLQETGVVDEIIPEDSRLLAPLFSEDPGATGGLRARLGAFDLIMGWTNGQQGYLRRVQAAAARPGGIHLIHVSPQESGPLSRLFFRGTAEIIDESCSLSIDEWARLPTERLLGSAIPSRMVGAAGKRRFIVVHPGSGSESKRWPLHNFLRIISRLGERGVTGVLVTGEAEEKMAAEVERAVLPQGWTWVRRPGLLNLASLLSKGGLYLGNDSGVTHLAAACGAEVVALFRWDLVTAWQPLGQVHLHFAASLTEVNVEAVWETIASRLPNFSADSQNS